MRRLYGVILPGNDVSSPAPGNSLETEILESLLQSLGLPFLRSDDELREQLLARSSSPLFLLGFLKGLLSLGVLESSDGLRGSKAGQNEIASRHNKTTEQILAKAIFVSVDFSSTTLDYRVNNKLKQQSLVKALGLKSGQRYQVLDATAGLGKDAFLIANTGCRVTLLERSPVIFALLQDGLSRLQGAGPDALSTDTSSVLSPSEIVSPALNMSLRQMDFLTWPDSDQVDVVYLDPMFPESRKTARVKKDMFLLQQWFSHGERGASAEAEIERCVAGSVPTSQSLGEEEPLLRKALKIARRRVVVKRPRLAKPLVGELAPGYSLNGKTNRYDVYLLQSG